MTIEEVAAWHRAYAMSMRNAESNARSAGRMGCEDAEFHADGWREMAAKHTRMAEVIEDHLARAPA